MRAVLYRNIGGVDISIVEQDGAIARLSANSGYVDLDAKIQETPLLLDAARQMEEYFTGARKRFELPLILSGTDFQRAVWCALTAIPYGQTRSYRQIAEAVGRPLAARAVGQANHHNPVWIVVPCHRVIQNDGSLGGYGGGLELKRRLLKLEAGNVQVPSS